MKSALIGFLSGAAVGTVAALLYAPQKGKYLRAEIGRRATRTADDVKEYVYDTANKVSHALRGVEKKAIKAA